MPGRQRFQTLLLFGGLACLSVGGSAFAAGPRTTRALYFPILDHALQATPASDSGDICKREKRSFSDRVSCGEPAAVGALAACCSAGFALLAVLGTVFIGITALMISSNARRGQTVHEQIRMVLDIDRELINHPEFWKAHGKTIQAPVAGENEDAKAKRQEEQKLTEDEAKLTAFILLYLNMFDYVYGYYGRRFETNADPDRQQNNLLVRGMEALQNSFAAAQDKEEWNAWKDYMGDFFARSTEACSALREYASRKVYSKSFISFAMKMIPPSPK